MPWLLALTMFAFANLAEARLYQWTNPKSGSVQFSGAPPSWYRSDAGGSRVLVFERGKLIDDTGVGVSAERGRSLREEAFREFDERKELEALRKLEQAARRDAARERARALAQEAQQASGDPDMSYEPDPAADEEVKKAILDAWDLLGSQLLGNQ